MPASNWITELDRFSVQISAFLHGALTADEFKALRMLWGVHQQRQKGKYFLRVRVPGGLVEARHLDILAEIAEDYSPRPVHVTTRQNFQIYFLELGDIPLILRRLEKEGLTSRRAAGNTVRNITACPLSGFCPEETFDVTPWVQEMSSRYLTSPLAERLPRKVKMAVSGCARDCAMVAIHDIGLVACARRDGRHAAGFRVLVGGGLGALPRPACELESFVPAAEVMDTVEAVLRVFHRRGERAVRGRARMKFLLEKMGMEAFRREVDAERNAVLREAEAGSRFVPSVSLEEPEFQETVNREIKDSMNGFERWRTTNVWPQKQDGMYAALSALPLGEMTPAQLRVVSGVSRLYGRSEVRTTVGQNIAVPWVVGSNLETVYGLLRDIGLGSPCVERACDVSCCAGADTCASAMTRSRSLAVHLARFFQSAEGRELREKVGPVRIKASGCLNSCGQHAVADVGLAGSAHRLGTAVCPVYTVSVGGFAGNGEARMGRVIGAVPAHRTVAAVRGLLQFYLDRRKKGEDFHSFAARTSLSEWKDAVTPWEFQGTEVPSLQDRRDLGSEESFQVDVRPSEC